MPSLPSIIITNNHTNAAHNLPPPHSTTDPHTHPSGPIMGTQPEHRRRIEQAHQLRGPSSRLKGGRNHLRLHPKLQQNRFHCKSTRLHGSTHLRHPHRGQHDQVNGLQHHHAHLHQSQFHLYRTSLRHHHLRHAHYLHRHQSHLRSHLPHAKLLHLL